MSIESPLPVNATTAPQEIEGKVIPLQTVTHRSLERNECPPPPRPLPLIRYLESVSQWPHKTPTTFNELQLIRHVLLPTYRLAQENGLTLPSLKIWEIGREGSEEELVEHAGSLRNSVKVMGRLHQIDEWRKAPELEFKMLTGCLENADEHAKDREHNGNQITEEGPHIVRIHNRADTPEQINETLRRAAWNSLRPGGILIDHCLIPVGKKGMNALIRYYGNPHEFVSVQRVLQKGTQVPSERAREEVRPLLILPRPGIIEKPLLNIYVKAYPPADKKELERKLYLSPKYELEILYESLQHYSIEQLTHRNPGLTTALYWYEVGRLTEQRFRWLSDEIKANVKAYKNNALKPRITSEALIKCLKLAPATLLKGIHPDYTQPEATIISINQNPKPVSLMQMIVGYQ